MIHVPVDRPPPPDDKINTSDSFELCYMRHQYFRRVKYNPTEAEMQPFMKIVEHFTKNTFFTYFNLFKNVGMYHDDILNIGRVHLVSFLGLYALDKMDAKKKEFIDNTLRYKYKESDAADFEQKDKANFTMFFKQRMEDLVRVCRQKVRNIKGQPSEEYQVFCGADKPPKYVRKLLREHKDLNYRKVDFSVFKSIRKRAEVSADATIFQFGNLWYVAIALDQKPLEIDDLVGSEYNPYDNLHNAQPDTIFEEKEEQGLHLLFNKKSSLRKKVVLRNFIAKNQYKAQYREEIVTAKKLLKSLGE